MFGINKDFFWVACGQIVSLLNNFLLLKVLTVNLSVAAYGYYTLAMSILLFIRQSVFDPVSIISAKESKEGNFLEIHNLSSFQIIKYLTDKLLIAALLLGFLSIFIEIIFYKKIAASVYISFGIVYLVSNGAQGIYLNILNILKKRKLASVGIVADSCVKVTLVYFALVFFENELVFALVAVALSSFLVFIWVRNVSRNFYTPMLMNSNDQLIVAKKLFFLSLPLYAPTLLIALKGLGDKVFMATFIGVEELAAYNVLLQLGFMPMMLIIGVIQTYISPDIYKATSLGKNKQMNTVAHMNTMMFRGVIASIPAIITAHVLSETIFNILVGVEYYKYSKFLPLFVMAGTFAGMSGLLNVGVIGAFKPRIVGLLMASSVSIGLIILMISIAMYGFEGGIAGLVFSNFVMLVIFWTSLRFISFEK